MASSGSLRDLYTDTRPIWTFAPPADNANSSTSVMPDASSAYTWSTRPRPNSIYELSPELDFEPSASNAAGLIRAAAASAILQYLSAAVENPWEVGKTLLQVQYVPRNIEDLEEVDQAPEGEEEACQDIFLDFLIYPNVYQRRQVTKILQMLRTITLPTRRTLYLAQIHLVQRTSVATLFGRTSQIQLQDQTGCFRLEWSAECGV